MTSLDKNYRLGFCIGALMISGATVAADPLQEVTVTGSRITRSGFTAPTPTTLLSGNDLNLAGVTNVGELVFEMPQFQPTQTTLNVTGGTNIGSNSYNLRGLGLIRTLTLVDGRRHVPDQINGTMDTNLIPAGIIERVEVVTGGASAAYGSDAVAGVVNIILRDNVDGLEGSVQGGETFQGDNREIKGTLTYGTAFAQDKGHLILSGEVSDADGSLNVLSRDWAQENWGIVINPNFVPGTGQFRRILTSDARTANATRGGLILNGALAGTTFLPGGVPTAFDGGLYPFNSGGTIGGNGDYNRQPVLSIPLKRRSVYARLKYDFTDNLRAFVDATYAHTEGFTPNLFVTTNAGSSAITLNQDNAFLPAPLAATLLSAGQTSFQMGRQNWDFDNWAFGSTNRNRQIIGGLEGKLGNVWRWSASYQYGESHQPSTNFNDVIRANLASAADAVVNPVNGQIVCRSSLTNPGNGCVPINLFGEGSPSPQALEYITDTFTSVRDYKQDVAQLTVQGDAFSVPAGPVSIAAGAEYRKERLSQSADPISRAGGHATTNWVAQVGDLSVREAFAETVIPLLADRPFARKLDFNAAVRTTDHSLSGNVMTWKAGFTYDLNDQLRLRATRSRDIRSPTFNELLLEGPAFFSTVIDLDGTSATIRSPTVGNADLQPEKANTWTAGVIYQPSWATGLRASVDYWNIEILEAISTLTAQQIIDACGQSSQQACASIVRDSGGALSQVNLGYFNAASNLAHGLDLELAYVLPASTLFSGLGGNFTMRALGTYMPTNKTTLLGQVTEAAGAVVPSALPKWRANASLSYANERVTLQLAGRYVDGVVYNNSFGPEDLNRDTFSGRFYTSLAAQYRLGEKAGAEAEVFGNVENLFDVNPSIIPTTGTIVPATPSQYNLYDPLGRRYMVGMRFKW